MFEAVGERILVASLLQDPAKAAQTGRPRGASRASPSTTSCSPLPQGHRLHPAVHLPRRLLPSPSAFRAAAARQGLAVQGEHAFGEDYARTLAEWRQAFDRNWPRIAALGFDEPFRRLWRLYLCYCEAGFLAGNIDVFHFELTYR
jgi:cyclopropane-fatty-acyl-phospholipid synthase